MTAPFDLATLHPQLLLDLQDWLEDQIVEDDHIAHLPPAEADRYRASAGAMLGVVEKAIDKSSMGGV